MLNQSPPLFKPGVFMKLILLPLLTLVTTAHLVTAQTTNPTHPFGTGDGLSFGYKPDISQEKLNKNVIDFYRQWVGDKNGIEAADVVKGNGDGYLAEYKGLKKPVYLVFGQATGDEPESWKKAGIHAVSTSEQTGYGMLAFVLMAGTDINAHKYFDGMLNLYLRNITATEIV